MKNDTKQRLTVFVDPISEVVEQALDAYAPNIEKASDRQIYVKFPNYPVIITSKSPVKK